MSPNAATTPPRFFPALEPRSQRAHSAGTTVIEMMSEHSKANDTTQANCLKVCAETPPMNSTGTNTATVVNVDAVMAVATSPLPSTAARFGSRPSSRWRKMFSSTTIELSTNMPTPSASPPKLTVLSVKPLKYISAKVAMTEIGIATPMISVEVRLRRKNSSTNTASTAPASAALSTLRIDARMNSAESQVASRVTSG